MSNNSNSSSIKMWHFYTRQTYQIGIKKEQILKKIPCCIHCSCLFGYFGSLQLEIFVCTLLCKKTVILSIWEKGFLMGNVKKIWFEGNFILFIATKPLLCQKVFTIQSKILCHLFISFWQENTLLFFYHWHVFCFLFEYGGDRHNIVRWNNIM